MSAPFASSVALAPKISTRDEIKCRMKELEQRKVRSVVQPSEVELELMFADSERWNYYHKQERKKKTSEDDSKETSELAGSTEDLEGFSYYIRSMARNDLTVLRTSKNFKLFQHRKLSFWTQPYPEKTSLECRKEYSAYLKENSTADSVIDAFKAQRRAKMKRLIGKQKKRDGMALMKKIGILSLQSKDEDEAKSKLNAIGFFGLVEKLDLELVSDVKVLRVIQRYLEARDEYKSAVSTSAANGDEDHGWDKPVSEILDDYILTTYCVLECIARTTVAKFQQPSLVYIHNEVCDTIMVNDYNLQDQRKVHELKNRAQEMILKAPPSSRSLNLDLFCSLFVESDRKHKKKTKKTMTDRALKHKQLTFTAPLADEKMQAKQKEHRHDTLQKKRAAASSSVSIDGNYLKSLSDEAKYAPKSVDASSATVRCHPHKYPCLTLLLLLFPELLLL